ncbi:MAG: 4-hydroxythreonine-4-phosphate dehydrogenase PdxA [Marinilabiliaceae bacterium]|nr:4-hydroxythreonine-4-phosphate dehydrogenase PdxA [Marinilabiliaceae bacterium]
MEKIKVGITQGDINGIGYEIILKSMADPRITEICTPVIYGSSKVAAYHRKALDFQNISMSNVRSGDEANPKRINIVNCLHDDIRVELGKVTEISGDAALKAIEKAASDLKKNAIQVLVTAPINKKAIQCEKFDFPGHTEYLAQYFGGDPMMLFVKDNFKIGVVTGHIPLKYVPGAITKERIINKINTLNQSLKIDFNIGKPKIAVLGLNPHASDNGLLGVEENEIILPALEYVCNNNDIMALGPYPADGIFSCKNYKHFDAILAMYHDQGLIPFKSLECKSGVNFTAGLPIIRTSPDHGTAFEIVGQNVANHESFLAAIYLAVDIYNNRKEFKELTSNPLQRVDLSTMGNDGE